MALQEREIFLRELERHFDSLYSYSRWMTRNSEEAEDIVHDAVARAIAHWTQFSPGTSMRAWLFTILRRTYLNRLRRASIEVTSARFPDQADQIPDQPSNWNPGGLPSGIVRKDIDKALAALSEDHRSMVLLADVEEFTLREIAEIEDIPVGTVKSRLWRARMELREKLTSYEGNR
ncbi:MAG: RNA polymerase sigma factor [bacterium]|nr:RNA polymerase sigma factor [bacterium]